MKQHKRFGCWLLLGCLPIIVGSNAKAQETYGRLQDSPEHIARVAAVMARVRQAEKLVGEANALLENGEPSRAVPLLQHALQLHPLDDATIALADIYIAWNRPADALQTLQPIVYPPSSQGGSVGQDVRTRMKYILALLDTRQWTKAATLYEQSIGLHEHGRMGNLRWNITNYGAGAGDSDHWLPDMRFSPEVEDMPGLRAQAHLILGTRWPMVSDITRNPSLCLQTMLDHIQQALKSNPRSTDAQFVSGVLLREMGRYDEARTAFARTAQMAPAEAQPEIKAALDKLNRRQEQQKAGMAQQARKQAAQAQGKTGP